MQRAAREHTVAPLQYYSLVIPPSSALAAGLREGDNLGRISVQVLLFV